MVGRISSVAVYAPVRVTALTAATLCLAAGCVNWCMNDMHEGDRFEITLDDRWGSTDRFDWTALPVDDRISSLVGDAPSCGATDMLTSGFRIEARAGPYGPGGNGYGADGYECTGFAAQVTSDVGLTLRQADAYNLGNALSVAAETWFPGCRALWHLGVYARRPDALNQPIVSLGQPPVAVLRMIATTGARCPPTCADTWAATVRRL